jgi:hypothetical protein
VIKGCPKKVKQGGAKRGGFHSDHEGGEPEPARDSTFEGYGDEQGRELVEVWECAAGCPVGELEEQQEGLSRYFSTFRFTPEELEELRDPFRYQPKPGRDEKEAGCQDLPVKTLNRVNPGGLENDPRWKPLQVHNNHPTVKSIGLMRWLCRLITPPGGVVADFFCGSGTTGCGAVLEGFGFIGFDQNLNDPDADEIRQSGRRGYRAGADRVSGRRLSEKEGGVPAAAWTWNGTRLPVLPLTDRSARPGSESVERTSRGSVSTSKKKTTT